MQENVNLPKFLNPAIENFVINYMKITQVQAKVYSIMSMMSIIRIHHGMQPDPSPLIVSVIAFFCCFFVCRSQDAGMPR